MLKTAARPLFVAALALGLLACSSEEDADNPAKDGLTLDEAQDELEGLARPQAGQYRQTVQVRKLEVPGAPDSAVAQMRDMMEQQSARTFCLTEEQAEKGFEEMYRQVTREQDCEYENFDVSGGRIDAALTCKGEQGVDIRMTLNGTATPTSSDMVMGMKTTGGGMNMDVEMAMQAERTGDCPA